MGHVDEGDSELALELAQLHAHPELKQPIEVAERLVQQEQLRARDQDASERDTLLLTAGQLGRLAAAHLTQAEQVDDLVDTSLPLLLVDPRHAQPELDVADDALVREQGEVLEHRRRRTPGRWHTGQILPVELDLPRCRHLVAADHAQDRRLPAP